MKEMCNEKKAKAKENGSDNVSMFAQGVLYVRMCDVEEGVKIDTDQKVLFNVYTDSQGVGACNVTAA